MRILCLDIGTKRVGVARSDEMAMIATGVSVMPREPSKTFLDRLAVLVRKEEPDRLVLGLPRRMDGSLGPEAHRVLALADRIREHLRIDVVTWDERLSTVEAERVLLEADMSRAKRRSVIDKVAATVILQTYLDHLQSQPRTGPDGEGGAADNNA